MGALFLGKKLPFLACLYESTGSYFCHPDMGMGITIISFMTEFSYVMYKALSSKLSCTYTGLVIWESEFKRKNLLPMEQVLSFQSQPLFWNGFVFLGCQKNVDRNVDRKTQKL